MLAGPKQRAEILGEIRDLCIHILENRKNIGLCKDILLMKASANLLLGNSKEVMEELEEINQPESLFMQGEGILINACLQAGELEKANDFTQVSTYLHILTLVNEGMQYMMIHRDDLQSCEQTLRRITALAHIYSLEELNFNAMAVFYYQMAIIYCQHNEKAKAIEQLYRYSGLSMQFLESEVTCLKKAAYFDRLDIWFEKILLAGNIPRDKKLIYDSMLLSFETPSFEILRDEQDFVKLKNRVERFGALYESDKENTVKSAFIFAAAFLPFAAVGGFFTGKYAYASYPAETRQMIWEQIGDINTLAVSSMVQSMMFAVLCAFVGYILAEKTGLLKPLKFQKNRLIKTVRATLAGGVIFSLTGYLAGLFHR